ncbi:glycosyltransferase [Prosthecobacter sp.]|uniref:glycosyltransferase n=1 Tax=Prosthecobacter sp. TaxID=1965333 RepID=UPI0037846F5E
MKSADCLSTAAAPEGRAAPLVVLAPHALRRLSGRPARYLDPLPMPACGRALIGATFEDDEELEREYIRRQTGALRRMRASLGLIFRNRGALRQADMIYCLDGMHYNLLLLLARAGLFRARGKIIRRLAFHDSILKTLAPLLKKAAGGFQIEFISHEQCARAAGQIAAERVVHRTWKIDCEWYHPPAVVAAEGPALLTGNASRDDAMVDGLLQRGMRVTRIGRSDRLAARFAAHEANPNFRLITNASHVVYREVLQASSVVLLPILECDDPAGMTAALESMASGIPVIANRSMGLSELFAACEYPVAMMENRDPEAWAGAIREVQQKLKSPDFTAALGRAREFLLKHHHVLPGGEDWSEVHRAACEPRMP